jgi:hypothetical protein
MRRENGTPTQCFAVGCPNKPKKQSSAGGYWWWERGHYKETYYLCKIHRFPTFWTIRSLQFRLWLLRQEQKKSMGYRYWISYGIFFFFCFYVLGLYNRKPWVKYWDFAYGFILLCFACYKARKSRINEIEKKLDGKG